MGKAKSFTEVVKATEPRDPVDPTTEREPNAAPSGMVSIADLLLDAMEAEERGEAADDGGDDT